MAMGATAATGKWNSEATGTTITYTTSKTMAAEATGQTPHATIAKAITFMKL